MLSDFELLDQYVRGNRQDAFAALLDRYLKLVYSAALRQVRSPELAEEVAQSVFIDLARNAKKLEPQTILTAWLYQVTRRTAIDVVRRESRRQLREQIALDMAHMNSTASDWTAIEPLLDEAMEQLPPLDRTAILLRYFEDKSLREVGSVMGISEDAAQKRVARALEQLRASFSRRGRAIGVGSLGALIAANAVQSAPAGLSATILTTTAISGAVAPIAGTIGVVKTAAMTTLQKTLIGATLVAAVGTGVYEARRASALQEEMQKIQQESAGVVAQNDPLRKQLEDVGNRVRVLQTENERLSKEAADVVRLRAEVAKLRSSVALTDNDPTAATAQSWVARVKQLKQWLQESPSAGIPEFTYLTEKDWLNAVQKDLKADKDYLRAAAKLRTAAQETFIDTALRPALSKFQKANAGAFPNTFSQLQPYFDPPIDDATLQRWQVAPRSTVRSLGLGGETVITQVAPVDPIYDTRFGVGPDGATGSSGPQDWDTPETSPTKVLAPVFKAYFDANKGLSPDNPSQLAPYLTTPEQKAALELLIRRKES